MKLVVALALAALLLVCAVGARAGAPQKGRAASSRAAEKRRIAELKEQEALELDKAVGRREKAQIRRRYKLLRKQARAAARAERAEAPTAAAEEAEPQKMLK